MTEPIKLTKRELDALVECNQWVRGTYVWRVKSMEKLAQKGLVGKVPHLWAGYGEAWEVSTAGLAYLERLEVKE